MKDKVVSARNAIELIQPHDTVITSGFVGTGTPEALIKALEQRYLRTQTPSDITLVFAAAPGDGASRGVNRLAHPGLIRRIIGGHWGLVPKLGALALENRIEAYNLPLGVMSQLFREIAGGRGGLLTRIGLGTFIDPRQDGGRLNARTREALVELVTLGGEEWLWYKPFAIDVALIRGTTADAHGNVSMEREALTLDNLAIATAAHNSGGIVIAQVERLADVETLLPRQVEVPGVLVDYVVVADAEDHKQTWATAYSPAFAGEVRVDLGDIDPMPLDARKIIERRAALELPRDGIVNLGIGMPEGVARVASEEGILDHITLTAEPGVIGGMPQGGLDFGAAINNHGLLHQNQQFDFYDGGGLDIAVLGMAEVDANGHVNVSKFGPKLAGVGGFVNISQSARRVVFTGTFTAGGLKTSVAHGALRIDAEGRVSKFAKSVEQITFNGEIAAARGQHVLYVTERCVLELTPRGLRLAEVAPGIDIERDILALLPFDIMVERPAQMDARIFRSEPMNLARQLGVDARSGEGTVIQLQAHANRRAKRRTSAPTRRESNAAAKA
jgi:propionate CoA-transferase